MFTWMGFLAFTPVLGQTYIIVNTWVGHPWRTCNCDSSSLRRFGAVCGSIQPPQPWVLLLFRKCVNKYDMSITLPGVARAYWEFLYLKRDSDCLRMATEQSIGSLFIAGSSRNTIDASLWGSIHSATRNPELAPRGPAKWSERINLMGKDLQKFLLLLLSLLAGCLPDGLPHRGRCSWGAGYFGILDENGSWKF